MFSSFPEKFGCDEANFKIDDKVEERFKGDSMKNKTTSNVKTGTVLFAQNRKFNS